MQHEPDDSANDRTVDADELQIAADFQFDFLRDRFGVPMADRVRNQSRNSMALIVDDGEHRVAQPCVQPFAHGAIFEQALRDACNGFFDTALDVRRRRGGVALDARLDVAPDDR